MRSLTPCRYVSDTVFAIYTDCDATRDVSSLAHASRAHRAKGRRGVVCVCVRRPSLARGVLDVVFDVDVLFVVGSNLVERRWKVGAERDDGGDSTIGRQWQWSGRFVVGDA